MTKVASLPPPPLHPRTIESPPLGFSSSITLKKNSLILPVGVRQASVGSIENYSLLKRFQTWNMDSDDLIRWTFKFKDTPVFIK